MAYAELTENIIDKLVPLDGHALKVQQLRCARVRNRHVECLRCAEACTSGAIAVTDGHLEVEVAKCVGCGTCATVCPTGALEARNPVDAELEGECARSAVAGEVVFMCSQAAEALSGIVEEGRVARVVCAGRIDETLLASLAARDMKRIDIVCGRCNACEQRHGLATAELVAETARTLFRTWGADVELQVGSAPPERALAFGHTLKEAREVLNRHFASQVACPPVNTDDDLARMAEARKARESESGGTFAKEMHVMADGTLAHFVPERRERLLEHLGTLGEPADETLDVRLWGKVAIDTSKCESCLMCATFCPTGALQKFADDDGKFGVVHRPEMCVKCRSCENICHVGAITVSDEVGARELADGTSERHYMAPRPVALETPTQMADTYSRLAGIPIRDF